MKMKRHWKLKLKSVNFQSGGALPNTNTISTEQQQTTASKPPSLSAATATTSQQQKQLSSKNQKDAPPPISSSSVGYKLLQKAGWKEGSAIGAQQQGLLEPLQAIANLGTVGIGYVDEHDGKKKKIGRSEEEEDVDTKIKRVRQVMQTEADEQVSKEISQYIYRSFKQDGCSGIGEQTADDNPLLRKKGKNKLSLTNPLL
jgi:ATP-dependent Clp protease ATP-binding subunit ClpB